MFIVNTHVSNQLIDQLYVYRQFINVSNKSTDMLSYHQYINVFNEFNIALIPNEEFDIAQHVKESRKNTKRHILFTRYL